jgi:putative acetyltransferase
MAITNPVIRPIRKGDNAAIAAVIRVVMPEFGACGPGFAINDAEVDAMFEAYQGARSRYFVIDSDAQVLGGGGIAPLANAAPEYSDTCELRKMYYRPEIRGRGLGRRLLAQCLASGRELGYRRCYLETLTGMDAAQHLYRSFGFAPLCNPLGSTGHFSCDRYFLLTL